ncbi:hypothetical protein CMI37_07940 [Candidatus Pacearchaeota archaeon]|nr:hypothetical protein [Candidatus Pacearchaeota archaeon]|tara:strand:- start:866 stop:1165 length:300 start_codon:yes stop_codon:yes gene_type:complete
MPSSFFIDNAARERLLGHIKETIHVFDYPTSAVFSAVVRLSIVSYMRGIGLPDEDIEARAVTVFRQLSEFASKDSEHAWFENWCKKLVTTVKEKKVAVK